jgi:hypothetical protein
MPSGNPTLDRSAQDLKSFSAKREEFVSKLNAYLHTRESDIMALRATRFCYAARV